MSIINISGYDVLVDNDDYERILCRHWYMNQSLYKKHHLHYFVNDLVYNKKKVSTYLHRFIMNMDNIDKRVVDHINGNTLDCRKQNLRICSTKDNVRNQKISKSNSSGYKGVQLHSTSKKWLVKIMVDGHSIFLGLYADPKEAAIVYDIASIHYFGEFARINFNKEDYIGIDISKFVDEHISQFSSAYIGVSCTRDKKWVSSFTFNKNRYYLGIYDSEVDAAIARDKKAYELMGSKARLNFPIDTILEL